MQQSDYLMLVSNYSLALLDAHSPDERLRVIDEIADDRALAAGILMLLSEQLSPLLPDVQLQEVQIQ